MASRDGVVDLHRVPGDLGRRRHRALLLGRLQHLAKLGLAENERGSCWTLRPEADQILRALGERGDMLRTLQRTFPGRVPECRAQGLAEASPRLCWVRRDRASDGSGERGYVCVELGGHR